MTMRTLFFNLSHLRGAATTHYLYMAGRKYQLQAVQDDPRVLAEARRHNGFLLALPDDQVTHYAAGVHTADDAVTLAYLTCNENPDAGTWEMTGMHMHIPSAGFESAYKHARRLTPSGPLPLSCRRHRYGLPGAQSLQDLVHEQALVDTSSFAATMVGLHPDVLSIEPASAAHVHANYIATDSNTRFLDGVLRSMGPAVPQDAGNVSGATPWATLQPLLDKHGNPYKKHDKKLNQYWPSWNGDVAGTMATALVSVHPKVKNDPVLGLDVTGLRPSRISELPEARGKLWARHDGTCTVEPSAVAVAAARRNAGLAAAAGGSGPTLVFTNQSAETGLVVGNPSMSVAADGRAEITLGELSNWFLRWLGVWVQFVDKKGKVLPLKGLPNDTFPAEPGPYPRSSDKPHTMFLGVVPPAFALFGIPVQAGSFAPKIRVPKAASSVRIFYTGLGLAGREPQEAPKDIYDHGALLTVSFNYALVGVFMAAGMSSLSPIVKLAVSLGGGAIAAAIQALVGGVTNQSDFATGLAKFAMNFLKVLFQVGNARVIVELVEGIYAELAAAAIIDSIPVAGQVAEAVAAVVGGIQLAETSIEIAISPPAYVFDCVLTHDLSVTFLPDTNNIYFPDPGRGNALYYKVSYLFDSGKTPYTLSAVDVPDHKVTSIAITLPGIPFGGQVNVSIGFYVRKATTPAGQNDWCAGNGTTGLTNNTVDVIPPASGFHIIQINVPIDKDTHYIHSAKTVLDAASGTHKWQQDPDGSHAPPYIPPPDGQQPGLGGFGGITVRQETSQQQGYVGYAWTAYSSGVIACGGSAPGQFGQMANLNKDDNSAQNGYVTSQCGYERGLRIGYNLLTHKSLNIYLDTTTGMIRPVDLDPPAFAGPASNRSFGRLNLVSTACAMHPAGYVVSISQASNKIELLRLPKAAQSDSDAAKFFLARSFSGQGARPGLVQSPTAVVVSPDGAILVLEASGQQGGNNRIQAFDIGGNPVRYFKHQPSQYFLELPDTANNTYLDLAAEFSGYLYVLSTDQANNHRLDIYHPTQTGTHPICTTMNVNAAKLAVDFWRKVYSLNYEVLLLNGSIPAFTEPSVSKWLPSKPAG
jgi:hypothetical protein